MKELRSIKDINLSEISAGRTYFPSPDDWEDQVIYFLMADRFSDGKEQHAALYNSASDFELIKKTNSQKEWEEWGHRWNGGNLSGIISKLDYLEKLGISTLWISPIFKQVAFKETYHGYGIQNFLAIEPRLGTAEDLHSLVKEAHKRSMRVILDIIINHSGDVFAYESATSPWTGEVYPVKGFRDPQGQPTIPCTVDNRQDSVWPDGGIWPEELQNTSTYYRKGYIQNWENYPEYVEGDFFGLKNHFLGEGGPGAFQPSSALQTITETYKYWIAFADIDGFRIDTIKHMEWQATSHFVKEIHLFASSLGKNNFYLIGEITGGLEYAIDAFSATELDAALGINQIPNRLENCAKGTVDPKGYFDLFSNTQLLGENDNRWYQDNVVTMFDDHDMVSQSGNWKYRFAADKETAPLLLNALFLNTMTLGIPCIYYGTEQGFDGSGGEDSYIRECMFAGKFGAFRTMGRHFFDTSTRIYVELAKMLKIRKEYRVLRQGRQHLRPVSKDGKTFAVPEKIGEGRITAAVAWSRILNQEEAVLVFNTDLINPLTVFIPVDPSINSEGNTFQLLYSSNANVTESSVQVCKKNDSPAVCVTVAPAGCLMLYRNAG